MNFSLSKENIQPLAAGRNASQLEAALNAQSHEELLEQRKQFEEDIMNYAGDDPLELWFEYISWVEQSYPKSGKESALDDLLKKCLSKFEKYDQYKQDPRLIRVFIKFIDTQKNPQLYYKRMYDNGVGTMVADFYIAWAHYFDIADDFENAKLVYEKGVGARAAPVDQLKQTYERFQFSVGQRVVRQEEYRNEFLSNMEAQRNAFTSLHTFKRSKVGSIRTGVAVKSSVPGQVRQSRPLASSNTPVNVYKEEPDMSVQGESTDQPYRSVVEEIERSMVENKIEPGPWSKKSSSRRSVFHNVHSNPALKMAILEDDIKQPLPPDSGNLAINLPKNFVRRNKPQQPWKLHACAEDVIDRKAIPRYPKFYCHPNMNVDFQPEEYRAYWRLKQQNISNKFTEERDKFWGVGPNVPIRILKNFPRKNDPQPSMDTERPDTSSVHHKERYVCNLDDFYPEGSSTELSFEEIYRNKWRDQKNEVDGDVSMDITVCVHGRQSFGLPHIRRSIAAGARKSIIPSAMERSFRLPLPAPRKHENSGSDMEICDGDSSDSEADQRNTLATGSGKSVEQSTVRNGEPLTKPNQLATSSSRDSPVAAESSGKSNELSKAQWSIFNDDQAGASNKPTPSLATPSNRTKPLGLPVETGSSAKKSVEQANSQWSIFQDDGPTASNTPKPSLMSNKTRPLDSPAEAASLVKKNVEAANSQWSIFQDTPKSSLMSNKASSLDSPVETSSGKSVEQPKMQWSIFTDEEPKTRKLSNKIGSADLPVDDKEIFAVPQRPVSRPATFSERRPEPSPMRGYDTDTYALPMGPQTGAVKKSMRKSTITENAIPPSTPSAMTASGNIDTPLRSFNTELDYSLCTQAFNFDLAEQMASTPVSNRRMQSLTGSATASSALRGDILADVARDIQIPPQQSSKQLSTIMETTEGSTHTTTSTKSSTQFSSPEDDDLSKRSNVTNRTKFGGGVSSEEASATGKSDSIVACTANASCQVEKTMPTIQMTFMPEASSIVPNKSLPGGTAEGLPEKNYPFPIFEDTQATASIANRLQEEEEEARRQNQLDVLPSAGQQNIDPADHMTSPSVDQFHMQSLWIKDEPNSCASIPSYRNESSRPQGPFDIDESFTLPNVNQSERFTHPADDADGSFAIPSFGRESKSLAQSRKSIFSKDVNEGAMDTSVAEESFAFPNVSDSRSLLQTSKSIFSKVVNEPRMNASVAEESFALPSFRDSKSLAQSSKSTLSKGVNEGAMSQMADDTFALPNVRGSKSLGQSSKSTFSGDGKVGAISQTGETVADESFALPNVRESKSLGQSRKSIFSKEAHGGAIPQADDFVVVEESFALPQEHEPNATNRTFETDESSDDSENEIFEVSDATMTEDIPKIVQVQSLAQSASMEMSARISISLTSDEIAAHLERVAERKTDKNHESAEPADCDQSIYFRHNSILVEPSWHEDQGALNVPKNNNVYQHEHVDLEESRMVIDSKLVGQSANPFDDVLKGAILQDIQFMDELQLSTESVELVCKVPVVAVKRTIPFKDTHFDVLKCIGHGAYGRVYTVKHATTGTVYAVKKEMPANLWECFILNEVHKRIDKSNLSGFMKIDLAIIGNDGSLLFSDFSPYGTLLDVCNRVFTSMHSNVHETVVFILAYQMIHLVDQLHKVGILHLDLKPDNFLVMRPMSTNHHELCIQLIDFGNAVDLKQFPPNQHFNAAIETKHFVCIEMLENRPWVHQPDLFCLAATVHSVLFGKYMDVRKIESHYIANVKIPRYFHTVWHRFFNELINVPLSTSPDLNVIKQLISDAITADKNVKERVQQFNRFIDCNADRKSGRH